MDNSQDVLARAARKLHEVVSDGAPLPQPAGYIPPVQMPHPTLEDLQPPQMPVSPKTPPPEGPAVRRMRRLESLSSDASLNRIRTRAFRLLGPHVPGIRLTQIILSRDTEYRYLNMTIGHGVSQIPLEAVVKGSDVAAEMLVQKWLSETGRT